MKDEAVLAAIKSAVEAGIAAIGGTHAIKNLSMFPSARKTQDQKEVA